MNITEKVAYLKGLAKGLEIDETTKEGKLLLAVIDVLEDMADSVSDLESAYEELDEVIDVLDEDLGAVEKDFYCFDEDDDCCCDDDDCDCDCDDDLYEVVCPNCQDAIYLDESMLEEGSIDCPNCGQLLEFDYVEDEDEPEETKE